MVDITKEEMVNVYKMLSENPAWRKFCLNQHYGAAPDSLKEKEVDLEHIFLFYMSEEQRQQFAKFPQTLHIDGSHSTNRHGLNWVNLMVFDERGAGIPVGHAVVPVESEECIKPALEIVQLYNSDVIPCEEANHSNASDAFMPRLNMVV